METILVVDDVAVCRDTITELLHQEDFIVLNAAHGDEAIDLLTRFSVDLVLLDIVMPRLDGISLLRIIRRNRDWRDLPVILLTSAADREHVRTAAALGVQGYILKSQLSADLLRTRIRQCLGARVPDKLV